MAIEGCFKAKREKLILTPVNYERRKGYNKMWYIKLELELCFVVTLTT